jgi:hypothetical protein
VFVSIRLLPVVGVLALFVAPRAIAQDDMVANPFYKFWASSKVGATATHLEQTKLTGPESKAVPDGVDEKRITYKLVENDKDRVVVEMVVTEQDFLGYVQAAPTKYIYPAKLHKSHLERVYVDPPAGGKPGEETLKVDGKDLKVRTASGTVKSINDGEVIEYKLWLSDDVPGTIVKKVQTTKQKGDVIAETTTTLLSFKKD